MIYVTRGINDARRVVRSKKVFASTPNIVKTPLVVKQWLVTVLTKEDVTVLTVTVSNINEIRHILNPSARERQVVKGIY